MKKMYFLFFSLLSFALFAQEADRVPILEHFTNSRCGVCGARNPNFHGLRTDYEGQVNHVSYHPRFPYSSCIFYQANTDGNMVRTNALNVSGTPSVYLNAQRGSGSTLISASSINDALNESSFFEMSVDEELVGTTLSGQIYIWTRGTLPSSKEYKIYIMGVEAVVDYNAPNGEERHYNVFRRFAEEGSAISFVPAANGELVSIPFSIDVSNAEKLSEMYTLAFIEDNDGVVENSVSKFTQETVSTTVLTAESIKVYPNPVREQLNITNISGEWELLNLMGQAVLTGRNASRISVAHLPKGAYFLRAQDEKGQKVVLKVIKE